MAEIKTCEEYVLDALKEANRKLEELTEQTKEVVGEATQKIDNLNNAVEYANRVIGLLAQMNRIQKDKEEGKYKIVRIKDDINLDLSNENDKYVFNILAPIIGDQAIKEMLKKEQENKEEAKKEEAEEEKGAKE